MVERLLNSGAGVEVVVGPAGTGKTFALAACRTAWEQQGHRVIGAALAARAAAELQAGSGIASATLDSLLAALDDPTSGRLVPNCVVVVDEAGRVGTRKLARLLSHAETAGAKVVLVGDHRQLAEIAAGGAFRALAERLGAVELTENRRQRHQLDRFALAHLRHGRSDLALAVLARRASVVTGASSEAVRRQMVADWVRSRAAGEDVVMLATTRASVADLNGRARALLTAAGQLHGPVVMVDGSEFCVGDRVMTTRNRRGLGVLNGARGVVTKVDPENHTLVVHLDTGDVVVLSKDYLAPGHVVHAYASTVHKAQGMTCDRSLVLADDRVSSSPVTPRSPEVGRPTPSTS